VPDIPSQAAPAELSSAPPPVAGRNSPLSPADLALVAELLAGLLRASLSLPDALRTLSREAQSQTLREALSQVGEQVTAGVPLGEALRRQKGAFPELFIRFVEQGQTANDLCSALVEIVREYRSQARFREALWSQLIGPITTCLVFAGFIGLMLAYNVPAVFSQVYRQVRGRLPLPTRALLAIGELVSEPLFWVCLAGVLIVAAVIVTRLSRTPAVRRRVQNYLLRTPALGPYLRALLLGRFCRLLSLLLQRRIPLDVAMGLVRDSFTFLPMRDAAAAVAERVAHGTAAAEALAAHEVFPETLLLFVRGGQAHGDLAQSLSRVADMYEERADLLGARLRFLIYLICTLAVGLAVLWALLAAYMPIFRLQETFWRRR